MQILHRGTVRKHKLVLHNRDKFLDAVKGYENRNVVITIMADEDVRPLLLNNYYWGVVLEEIRKKTGENKHRLHSAFKYMYLGREVKQQDGKSYIITRSTRELTKSEFEEYLTQVIAEASNLGIYIPDISEVHDERY